MPLADRWKILLVAACLLSGLGARAQEQVDSQPTAPAVRADDVAALQAEVDRLKSIVPAQAVAMTQVAYNFSNLWFAVQEQNWPLAEFYLNETRVRLRWAIRISPVRKTAAGNVDIQPILDELEASYLPPLRTIVESHTTAQFPAAYDAMLGACYGCHVASDKPYLRLGRPTRPAEGLIQFSND